MSAKINYNGRLVTVHLTGFFTQQVKEMIAIFFTHLAYQGRPANEVLKRIVNIIAESWVLG
jgi:hypothetical protein